MKKTRFCSFFGVLVLLAGLALPAAADSMYKLPEDQTLHAKSAMVVHLGMNPEQDTVLFERDADGLYAPSNLIQIMVGAYALKQIQEKSLDIDKATGTYTLELFNGFVAGTGITTANMDFGETWTLRDLLTVTLIMSAGDAAATLAAALSPTGKVQDFIRGMNDLAEEIGCEHTSFSNVTGIGALSQFTTARDMYRIMRYAMDFPEFEGLIRPDQHTVKPVAMGTAWTAVTTNSMRRPATSYFYSPMVFGRTGTTDQGRRNMASLARDSGYDYIVIVLDCPKIIDDGTQNLDYVDVKMLYKWAFTQFTYKPLLTKNEIVAQIKVGLAWNKDKVALVPKDEFATVVYSQLKSEDIIKKVKLDKETVDAPVTKGAVYGRVELYVNLNQKIGEVELVAGESVEQSHALAIWEKVRGFMRTPWFYAGIGLLAALLAGYVILNITHNRKRRREHMQKLGKFK